MNTIEEVFCEEKLLDVFLIRRKVFIEEQGVEEDEEFDEHEPLCRHFLLYSDNQPIGTARIRSLRNSVKLERFALLKEFRRKGFGTTLLQYILEEAKLEAPGKIYLHAQSYVKDFYKASGFQVVGEPFLEAGIEHLKMEYRESDLS